MTIVLSVLSSICSTGFAQNGDTLKSIEISAAATVIIYQSAFAMENAFGFEAALSGQIISHLKWQAGTRIWLNPAAPEVFARVLVTDHIGAWTPLTGIEFGATGRGKFGDGSKLLRETRNAMLEDSSPLYLSSHIAPLSFSYSNGWRWSAVELTVGTHLENMGRTLRLQILLLSISKSF